MQIHDLKKVLILLEDGGVTLKKIDADGYHLDFGGVQRLIHHSDCQSSVYTADIFRNSIKQMKKISELA